MSSSGEPAEDGSSDRPSVMSVPEGGSVAMVSGSPTEALASGVSGAIERVLSSIHGARDNAICLVAGPSAALAEGNLDVLTGVGPGWAGIAAAAVGVGVAKGAAHISGRARQGRSRDARNARKYARHLRSSEPALADELEEAALQYRLGQASREDFTRVQTSIRRRALKASTTRVPPGAGPEP